MLRQCCNLCYDPNWIRKRGGCFGLKILLLNLLSEETMIKYFSNWFIQHFLTAFRAMMYLFSDFNKHVIYHNIIIHIIKVINY